MQPANATAASPYATAFSYVIFTRPNNLLDSPFSDITILFFVANDKIVIFVRFPHTIVESFCPLRASYR
jgi:hypothetical protein